MEIYQPREDTFLILKQIKPYAKGNVLDMGTGTGILAIEAAKKAKSVIGCDINKKALEYAKQKSKDIENIKFVYSDIFSYFKKHPKKFDLIIFNPPYLPEEKKEPFELRPATTGGKKGYELIDRFLSQAGQYLKPDGKILILFSTLTKKDKVYEALENYAFNYQKLAEQSFDFETLFVYLVEKSDFLKSVEKNKIKNVKKIAKGHRGLIYKAKLNNINIVIKRKRPESKAVGRIQNEVKWLKILNKKSIGPKLLFAGKDYFTYKYIPGIFIPEFLEKADKIKIKKILAECFKQCFIMDKLKANKEEMHHPYKHIIIDKKPVMIDFERMHYTEKTKNVSQFCQFITNRKILPILQQKGFSYTKKQIVNAVKIYKKKINKKNLKKLMIISFLSEYKTFEMEKYSIKDNKLEVYGK